MQEVPKIVRERLRVVVSPDQHPDANLLSAFAEGALPEREKATLTEHLARCGQCRDVVSLALPESESLEIVPVARRSWLTWPALRWGFALAGIAAITALGVLQYRQKASSVTTAMRVSAPSVAISEDKQTIPAAPASSEPTKESSAQKPSDVTALNLRDDVARNQVNADQSYTAANPPPPHVLERKRGNLVGGPLAQSAMKNTPAPQEQQQAQSNSPRTFAKQENAAGDPSAAPSAQALDAQDSIGQLDAKAASAVNSAPAKVDKAKPAVGGAESARTQYGVAAAKAAPSAPPASISLDKMQLVNATPTSLPRWTINSGGALQRSFDGGASWQDVSVLAGSAVMNAGVSTETVEIREKDAAKKMMKSQAGPQFRALAVNGAEVWAGGANTTLFHTSDAGAHWARVLPSDAGVSLTGDVVSITFPDSQHGRITTSTNEAWSTEDSGQTWRKQ